MFLVFLSQLAVWARVAGQKAPGIQISASTNRSLQSNAAVPNFRHRGC